MNNLILLGAGGCMREIAWQIQRFNEKLQAWNIKGFVDVQASPRPVLVGEDEIPYLGDDTYLLSKTEETNIAICIGNPVLRKKIVDNLKQNPKLMFPNLILGDTAVCPDIQMGEGCIISMDSRISTNVTMGDFVFLNIGAMVCHDGKIGDFVTLSPDVKLAGNVRIGNVCELGLGTKVIQGITFTDNVKTGAGCVVVKDILEAGTYVGVPAGKIRG